MLVVENAADKANWGLRMPTIVCCRLDRPTGGTEIEIEDEDENWTRRLVSTAVVR